MNTAGRWILAGFSLILFVAPLAGCDEGNPGPAERAGKKIDQAVDKLENKAEEAGQRIKSKVEDIKNDLKD